MKPILIVASILLLSHPVGAAELTPAEESWVEACVRRLASESGPVARGAERALSEFGVEALPAMVRASEALAGEDAWSAFTRVVIGFGLKEAVAALDALRPGWPSGKRDRLGEILAGLRAALRKADPAMDVKVRKELEPFRSATRYSSGDPRIRRLIAMGREAVPVLLTVLREPEPGVFYRTAAADALAALARDEDLPALARLLSDGTLVAARCFRAFRGEKARDALLAPVRKGTVDHDLIEALEVHRKDGAVQRALLAWVEKHGATAVDTVGRVAEFLADAGVFSAVPVLRGLPEMEVMDARRPVTQSLARLGDKEAIRELIEVFAVLASDITPQNEWHLHEAGEALNRIAIRRLYSANIRQGEAHKGNAQEAVEGFRAWWKENQARLIYERKWRRWKVER